MKYDNALHMMEKIGGPFIRSLAERYYRADENNRARLRQAFAREFERYERLYQEHKAHTESFGDNAQ